MQEIPVVVPAPDVRQELKLKWRTKLRLVKKMDREYVRQIGL